MSIEDRTSSTRLWIGLLAFTVANLGVWVGSSLVHRADPGLVQVDRSTTAIDFERTGRLGMVFDRSIFDDDQVGHSFDRSPFRIDPPIAGTWDVEDRDVVAFRPDAPPPAGRIYRVGLASTHPLFHRFEFDRSTLPDLRYRPLRLEDVRLAEVTSTPEGLATSATLEISFDQGVRPDDVAAATRITVDGREAAPVWRTAETPETIRCTVPVEPGVGVDIEIDEDLTARDGLLGLDERVRRSFDIAGTLTDLGTSTWRDRRISIRFDRTLETSQRMPKVTITPDPGPLSVRIQEQWLMINARFEHRRSYEVRVDPPLLAEDRSVLAEPLVHRVTIAPPEPTLHVASTSGQMMPGGSLEIPIRHFGNSSMHLGIHRLVDEHLPMVLAEVVGRRTLPRVGETVFEGSVPLESDPDRITTSLLDVGSRIDRRPGLYRIAVRSEDDYWNRHQSLLLVSDLAIEIQRTDEEILAWVTSISDGVPVEGATVTAWAPNITPIGSSSTDRDGLTRLALGEDPCRVVSAKLGDQVVFVRTADTGRLDDRSLAGAEWSGPLEVSFHADRGVHRPGETVHVSGILRTDRGEIPMGTPLSLRWIRPDERVANILEVVTEDDQGTFSLDLETDASDPTGHWMLECRIPGADRRIGRIECPIMPFLPVRLEVAAELITDAPEVGLSVSAKHLHGAPAVGLVAKTRTRFHPTRYTSDEHPDFVFERPPTSETVTRTAKTVLDEAGVATFPIEAPDSAGTWRVVATGSVSETGGRTTSATRRGILDTMHRHRGLHLPEGRVHEPGSPVEIDVVDIVDGEVDRGAEVSLNIERITRTWYRIDEHGRWEWRTREQADPVGIEGIESIGVRSDGSRGYRIPALPEGEYRITTTSDTDAITATTSIDLHVSHWRSRGRTAMKRPDRVEIIPDQTTVRPGEEVSVLLRAPFEGTALVTVETDRIHETRVVEIDGDGVRLDLPVPSTARSTCFVTTTLIRPVDPGRETWQAVLARGSVRLPIDRTPHELEPDLLVSDGARPGDTVRVSLSVPGARPGAMARLWAVEEGALLATGFKAPDPVRDFLRERRQVVSAASTLSDLLEDVARPMHLDRIGGDTARSRREPVPVRLPETKVIWRGFETLDEHGRLDIDLVMPEIDGAMRVMAVVVDEDRYGSVERKISVTAPIAVAVALPRSAAPGDLMRPSLTIRNNTRMARTIDLVVETGDGLRVEELPASIELQGGAETVIDLGIEAEEIGAHPIVIRALDRDRDPGIGGRIEWSIAVRPPTSRSSETRRFLVRGGDTVGIESEATVDLFEERLTVGIAATPDIDLAPIVDDLVRYPYGCCEQIGSTVQGLLAALDSPAIAGDRRAEAVRGLAAEGLSMLWRRQLRNGLLPYWSGGHGDRWLTLRTALLADRAEALEVPMPGEFLESLRDAVETMNREQNLSPTESAMACRVMAAAGRPDPAIMQRLRLDLKALGLDDRAHLARAHAVVGAIDDAREIIATFAPPPPGSPRQQGSFTSDGTQLAIALATAIEHHPTSETIPALHAALMDLRSDHGWRTTYENAAAVEAMAAFGRHYLSTEDGPGHASGVVEIAGERIVHAGPEGITRCLVPGDSPSNRDSITATGDLPIHVVITRSGHPRTDTEPAEHHGLRVERTWLDAGGDPIRPGTPVEAGDVVVVELQWRSELDRSIPNIAIVEVLPGGMEFELPTLITADATDSAMNKVDHAEFRDDRLLVFGTATPEPRILRFAMRAVVPGTWTVPGTRAEAMYQDAVHSRSPSGTVEIELP
ncbi:MAG: hypothetical protein CMJ34_15300 [Phycisphaerae bacterium]|nr:hypothetical protein [Phycisphaerae bacterium]